MHQIDELIDEKKNRLHDHANPQYQNRTDYTGENPNTVITSENSDTFHLK